MMGGAKSSAAVSAVSIAGSRRARAGTIAEVAAIARRAAEDGQRPLIVTPAGSAPANEQEGHPPPSSEPEEATSERLPEAPPQVDAVLLRRSRAGAGQVKDAVSEPDRTAAHLILAGRAYAYGKSIVHGDGAKKAGDSVAIES